MATDSKRKQELTEDKLDFHATVRVLTDHGFVDTEMSPQEQIESRGCSMHGCVHSWDPFMEMLSPKCIALHIPKKITSRGWLRWRRLL